jgi:hypothetical protein
MSKSKREKRLEAKLGVFLKQYQRKRHAGHDPNDRGYDRTFERKVKQMDPLELDELMNGAPSNDAEAGSPQSNDDTV